LDWFVKNPSCESVEVKKVEGRYVDYGGNVHNPISYEIIIPQEEPKCLTKLEIAKNIAAIGIGKEEPKKLNQMTECYFTPSGRTSSATICDNCGKEKYLHTIVKGINDCKQIIIPQEETKQETLSYSEAIKKEERIFNSSMMKQETPEEAAENYYKMFDTLPVVRYNAFIEGAKWQSKRMYSEEEVINAFNEGQALNVRGKLIQGKDWFEQFKKK
jgi:hypothetical protein